MTSLSYFFSPSGSLLRRLTTGLRALFVALPLAASVGMATAGSISGSVTTSTSTIQLTTAGSADWTRWGTSGVATSFIRKSNVTPFIPTYTLVGSIQPAIYTSESRRITFTDGTPTASSSSNRNSIRVSGIGNGFNIAVPADAQSRTVTVHVSGGNSSGTFTASLSDGSGTPYVNTTTYTAGTYTRNYTINYSADSPGKTLNLKWVVASGAGLVGISAASVPTFTYVNHTPVISIPAAITSFWNTGVYVSTNPVDSDGDVVSVTATGLPPGLSIDNSTGLITGTPTTAGSFSAVITARDPSLATATRTVSWTVSPGTNLPPSNASAVFNTFVNTAAVINPTWTDPNTNDTFSLAVVTQPSHGAVTVSNLTLLYTPTPGYVGPDSFTFSVRDGAGSTTVGTASGNVTAVSPDAVSGVTASQGTLVGSVAVDWPDAANAVTYNVFRGTSASDPSPILLANVAVTSYTDNSASQGVLYYYSIQSAAYGQTAPRSSAASGFSDTPPSNPSAPFSAVLETPVAITPTWTDPDSGDTGTVTVLTQPPNGTATAASNVITYTPNFGYVGADSFTYRITDRAGATIDGTSAGTVTALDPAVVPSLTATQGTLIGSVSLAWPAAANARNYNVLRGASSSDPAPVVLGNVPSTTYSDATALPGVQYYYFIQSATVGKTAARSPGYAGFADTPPTSPVANFTAVLNTAQAFTPTWTDPDSGDTGSVSILSQPSNGSVTLSGNVFTYTPNSMYVGPDSFTYRVTDRAGAFVNGTASGTVAALDPARVTSVTATTGTLLNSVSLSWAASANALTYNVLRGTSASDPSPATLGTVSSLNYSDSTASPGTQYYYFVQAATVGKTALPSPGALGFADTPPTSAVAPFAATLETPHVVSPTWTDPDSGDAFTLTVLSQPANGSVTLSSATAFTYTPNFGYVGPDTFTFRVTDRAGAFVDGTATGTVTALNPAPVASVAATQGTLVGSVGLTWSAAANARTYNVLRGASSNDPAPVTLASVGSTSYNDSSALPGVQYFYSIQSATVGKTATASTSTLGFADTPPTAATASFAAILETPFTVTPTWSDGDTGDAWTIAIVSPPANGNVSVVGSTILYTPNFEFVGTDTFTFRVTDRAGASTVGTATGSVTALDPSPVSSVAATQGTLLGAVGLSWSPSSNARTYTVLRGNSATDPAPSALSTVSSTTFSDSTAVPGVLYHYAIKAGTVGKTAASSPTSPGYADTPPSAAVATFAAVLETPTVFTPTWTDPDAGDTGSVSILTQPAGGTASVSGNAITYSPNLNFVGADSFTFRVTDRAGATVVGTASGTVTALDPSPVVSVTATQGTQIGSVSLAWSATANARTYRVLRGSSSTDPSPALVSTVASTSFTDSTAVPGTAYYYSIVAATVGKTALASPASLGFADTPPSAASGSFTTNFNTSTSFTPTWTDPDPSDVGVISVVTSPSNGSATILGNSITYVPNSGYIGAESFTFRVTDRAGATTIGTVTGSVVAVPPDPISGLTATKAARVGAVDVSWNTSPYAANYTVFRGNAADDPAPVVLNTITGVSYTDSAVSAGIQYFYSVRPNNTAFQGAVSSPVLGFSDTPPTAVSGTFTTLERMPITFVPTWFDPDPGEVFTLTLTTQPQHGVASITNNQILYTPDVGYLGADTFGVAVTDRAGAIATGVVTGSVEPGIPSTPLNIVATQGTLIGNVQLSWEGTLGAFQWLVVRSQNPTDPSPQVIATVYTPAFTDSNVTAGAKYYYRIKPVGVSGTGDPSQQVSGYADTPPISATAAVSTIYNVPVTFSPTVVDPDPLESFTVTINTTTANGTLVVGSGGKTFDYNPTVGFAGVDTFTFTATDVAGAQVTGTGSVSVGCPTPTVSSLSVSQPKIFGGSGFSINGSYGNTACPSTIRADFTVKSGTTVIASKSTDLTGVVSAPFTFAVDPLAAGIYVIDVKITDTVTGNNSASQLVVPVASYRLPTFTATANGFVSLDTATIAVGSSPDCTLTSNRSSAIADHNLCYYEVLPIPPGLLFNSAAPLPTWTGKVTASGAYSVALGVYQFDDFGAAKLLGSVTRSMSIQPLTSMTFSAPTTVNVAQYMQEAAFNVTQNTGLPCNLTTDRPAAIASAARGNRVCYLEFSGAPAQSRITGTGITSTFLNPGTETVSWTVSAIDIAGTPIPFSSGTVDFIVTPPDVSFDISAGTTIPIATITQASLRLEAVGTVRCVLTTMDTAANVPGVEKPCLVEWGDIPLGLSQDASTSTPLLKGIFTNPGTQPVGFNVSYYDVTGQKRLLISSTKPVTAESPPPPPLLIRNAKQISPDVLAVPTTGGNLFTIFVDVVKWPVDAEVRWSDQQFPITYRINARGIQIIPATAAPLWTKRTMTVKLFLRSAPSIFTEKTVEVVSVPVDGINLGLDTLPTTVPDSLPMSVTARVDMRSSAGPVYTADTMGQWSVQFGYKDSNSNFLPQGSPVITDANGIATTTLDPFSQTVVRVVAKATPVSQYPAYARTLDSPLRFATVVKGTPIDGSILVKGLSEGPAPLMGIFRAAFNTRSDQLANESVSWKISTDDGATYADFAEPGLQIMQRMAEGRYKVKAIFVNRNTRAVSESAPVDIRVWAVPKIVITGTTFAFPGTPINLKIALTHPLSGIPVASADTRWSVSKRVQLAPGATPPDPVATGTGEDVAFTGDGSGIYIVSVRSRMLSSNPDNEKSWGVALKQVVYGAPEKPLDIVAGPNRAEVGKSYTFTTTIRTRFDISTTNLKIVGKWILPDGTEVPGVAPITYTPTDADLATKSYITVTHQAWIEEYPDTTTAISTKSIPIWKYIWPSWVVNTTVTTPVAPTTARFTVLPDNFALLPTLDGLTYTWTVPPTVRVTTQPTSRLDAIVDYGGTSPISVVISDARGNSTTLETSVTVADAKPYVVDLVVTNQSRWTHSPIVVGLNTKTTGGHPLDSIITWKYFLDGVALDLPNKALTSFPINDPGAHTVEVRVTSKMNATASKSSLVNVPANQAPTCNIVATPTSNRVMVVLQSVCNDPDGSLTKYRWFINGVEQSFVNLAKWNYVVQPTVTYPFRVDLTVTDDGGAETTTTVTVN